ncbi:MAG TPA: hypothetical protein VG797_01080 [Phycisphaerales bacterium]|nr:hypothetical protein [Phycisphaerales bacterium]
MTMIAPLLAAALSASLVLCGCASTESTTAPAPEAATEATGQWIPAAEPKFATIARSTTYARVHSSTHDLLVFEDPYSDGTMIWLISIPSTARLSQPIDLERGEKAAARGWVIERLGNGRESHLAELDGRVVVHAKDAEVVRATADVSAVRGPAAAGSEFDSRVRLTRKLEWLRTVVVTPEYSELPTRSGVSTKK